MRFSTQRRSLMLATPLLAAGILAGAGSALPAAAPVMPLANPDEALYLQRLKASKAHSGLDAYDTLEAVRGASAPAALALAASGERSIAKEGLEAASSYAASNNTAAFLVWRDTLQQASYFGAALPSTLLVSRSLAKPLAAIAVGRAIERGDIKSLDQSVSEFITEWKGTPKAAIKVRHLLDMRSGLLEQGYSPDPQNIWNRAYLDPHHGAVLINNYPLVSSPGERFAYSNAAGDLVAILIERATRLRYGAFISEEVLKPIDAAGGMIWVDRPGGLAHSGCCILLPAESWLKLGLLLLNDGNAGGHRILPQGYVEAMRTPTPQNPYYGLGVYVAGRYTQRRGFAGPEDPGPKVLHSEPYLAADLYLFDGAADQVLYLVPSENVAILRMGGAPPKTPEWDNSRLPNLILGALRRRPGETASLPQP